MLVTTTRQHCKERNGTIYYINARRAYHNSIVLYCIVLYCIVLYCTVPYRTVPYRTVPYRTVPYRTVPYRIVSYRIVLYDTAETVCQSRQADARVCKCSMDSYPETRPNPTRECSATSNEADTRAGREGRRGVRGAGREGR